MKRIIFILSLIVTVLSGCISPAPIFTVLPAENEILWTYGVGSIDKTDQGISVLAGCEENRNNMLCFHVVINNKSENAILVDPINFECISRSSIDQDSIRQPVRGLRPHAIDPETQIRQIDIQLSQENSSYESTNTFEACGSLMNLILDIATIGRPESEEQQDEKEQQRENDRIRRIDQENGHKAKVESLNQEKYFWQSQTLRKTTLLPGQTIEGKVFFCQQEHAKFLQLRFPFHQACIDMWFIQEIIQP